jgi:pyridoxal phosphate enzyme (YggS family)
MTKIADNLHSVNERIASAASRAGRQYSDITLVAVTKKQTVATILEALDAGATDIGENYVQEAADKHEGVTSVRWHLLGHLQSNKAKVAVTLFDLVQSVDSLKLARALGVQAQSGGKEQKILLQVHLGDEETKFGLLPETVADSAAEIAALPGVVLQGLMGIAPNGVEPRPYFQQLRALFEALPANNAQILSMGMTGDFEAAIEEGATLIRIGTAIFGPRS